MTARLAPIRTTMCFDERDFFRPMVTVWCELALDSAFWSTFEPDFWVLVRIGGACFSANTEEAAGVLSRCFGAEWTGMALVVRWTEVVTVGPNRWILLLRTTAEVWWSFVLVWLKMRCSGWLKSPEVTIAVLPVSLADGRFTAVRISVFELWVWEWTVELFTAFARETDFLTVGCGFCSSLTTGITFRLEWLGTAFLTTETIGAFSGLPVVASYTFPLIVIVFVRAPNFFLSVASEYLSRLWS